MSHEDAGGVADVAGFVVEDFVAWVDDGAEGEIDGFADPDGDDDFRFGVVGDLEMFLDVAGDGGAEFWETEIGGVVGASVFEGEDGGFADVPRGIEVGFTDAEGDDFFFLGDDIEELADPGFWEIGDLVSEMRFEDHEAERRSAESGGLGGNGEAFGGGVGEEGDAIFFIRL